MSLLILERGQGAGKRIPLAKLPVRIGRDTGNDIVLDDDEVSRFHFRLKQRGRLFILEDLESKNGTYINGDKVLNSILQNGDKILVGSTELLFVTSEPDIRLATEIVKFDMVIAEDLGIKGPIDVDPNSTRGKFAPIRLNLLGSQGPVIDDSKRIRALFEMHSNLLVIDQLDEAAKLIIKYVGKIAPSAARAAIFVWVAANRQLVPAAASHFGPKAQFLISQRALEDVIARRQSLILNHDSAQTTNPGPQRLVVPIIHNGNPICVLHVECQPGIAGFAQDELEMIHALVHRCSPSLETMLLRQELDTWFVSMIETMIATVEAKDTYTRGHSERVSRYSMAIAEELKLNRDVKRMLLISSLCHDIGKIGIPDAILKKAAILSADEYDEMKLHPNIGADIIRNMPNAQRFVSGVKFHHEKWDGTGYPDGLAGEDIPFFGRIVGVADVFDAMVSGRAYSGFIDQSDAVERILEERDLFDPEILKAFVRAHESGTLTLKTHTQNQDPLPSEAPISDVNLRTQLYGADPKLTGAPEPLNQSKKKKPSKKK